MRVLFSGYHNPGFASITEYAEEAIRDLGHELAVFDNRTFALPGRIRERIPPLERSELRRLNRRLLEQARNESPDVFVESGGHRILPETVDALRDLDIVTALWTIDAPTDFEPVLEAAPRYDLVACGGTEAVEILEAARVGARWLPFACAPARHRAPTLSADERERYGSDVAFVGSYYPNRAEVLRGLADLDLAVWGPGWEQLDDRDPLRDRIRGAGLGPDEWVKIYAASSIAVVIHFHDGITPCHQASPKVFEILACGAFQLVDGQRDVFALFDDGHHLVRFEGAGDLREKVVRCLEDADLRREVARRGREAAVAHHTYRHRMGELLSWAMTKARAK